MENRDMMERVYPILQAVVKFSKDYTALFLGILTGLSPIAMFIINSLEYAYCLGYYHFGFNVPIVYLGEVYTSSIPFTFVLGVVGCILLILYSKMALSAYIECRFIKFSLEVFASVSFFS